MYTDDILVTYGLMREIEIKAHVKDGTALIERLTTLGCVLGSATTQDDVVYTKKSGSMEEFLSNDLFLRVRKTPDATIFTRSIIPTEPKTVAHSLCLLSAKLR